MKTVELTEQDWENIHAFRKNDMQTGNGIMGNHQHLICPIRNASQWAELTFDLK